MVFDDSVDENKELLKKYPDIWDGIKKEIKVINGGKKNDYEKDYMKIKFNSDDDLPLKKPLKLHAMTMIIRSVFEEDRKLYLQLFLDGTLCDLVYESYSINKLMFLEELTLTKQVHQKNVCFVIIDILNVLDLNWSSRFVQMSRFIDDCL